MISTLIRMELKKLVVQKEIYIILAICTLMIVLSQKAFYLAEDEVQLYRFSKSLLDFIPMVGYLFLLFPIIIAVARILPFEYEQKMIELLATYKYGRKMLLLVKLIVLFFVCAFIVFYFLLIVGGVSYFIYGLDNWMLDIESISWIYMDMYLKGEWHVWKVLAFEYVYLLLSTFTFALCLFLVAKFVRKNVFIMFIGGAVFLVVELFDKFVMRFANQMKIGEYINIIIKYSFNSLLNFEFLNIFTIPQILLGLVIGMLLLIIVNILVEGKTVND